MPPRRAPPLRVPLPVLGVSTRRRAAPRRVPEPALPVRPQRPVAPPTCPIPVLPVRPFPLFIRKRKCMLPFPRDDPAFSLGSCLPFVKYGFGLPTYRGWLLPASSS